MCTKMCENTSGVVWWSGCLGRSTLRPVSSAAGPHYTISTKNVQHVMYTQWPGCRGRSTPWPVSCAAGPRKAVSQLPHHPSFGCLGTANNRRLLVEGGWVERGVACCKCLYQNGYGYKHTSIQLPPTQHDHKDQYDCHSPSAISNHTAWLWSLPPPTLPVMTGGSTATQYWNQ